MIMPSMETLSVLLALCQANSPVTGEFPSQRPVTQSFDIFFDMRLNKRLSNQARLRWFETPSSSLRRHCYENVCRAERVAMNIEWLFFFARFQAGCIIRAVTRFAPSQWQTVLLCNNVSHWLGASLESGLKMTMTAWRPFDLLNRHWDYRMDK